jgi:ribosomal peptide maturation radical SAM protein 1
VLLVSMPMGALDRQALGLSLLKPRLAEHGIAAGIRYLTFAFAEFIGVGEYLWMTTELPYTAFAGDWLFTESLYGTRLDADRRYCEEVLEQNWHLTSRDVERLFQARRFVRPFLDHCLAAIPWTDYRVVGFTSTFEQNIASLALARRVKAAHPGLSVVFGGANWEGVMGEELHRQFPFVDYVCSGESEDSFPALLELVLAGTASTDRLRAVPGLVFRAAGESVATAPAPLSKTLDTLPVPDYGDYFREFGQSSATTALAPTLLFETSRGCWWGAKSHCTFCGLNGQSMEFRSKSATRVLTELETLTASWRVEQLEAVDNILDMRYFRDLLPALADAARPWRIFYEVKANLSRRHLALLQAAGVRRIQPGIESLSDHVLRLMRKGTTALRNIQLLKHCRELGIEVDWNILYGFPGETAEDYTATLQLLPAIRFLGPPAACGPVRLDRFSPYFEAPDRFGLVNVRPLSTYRHLYACRDDILARIAYYFDYDYAAGSDPRGHADSVVAYVDEWKRHPEPGSVTARPGADGSLILEDTRLDRTMDVLVLEGPERSAYDLCDELHSLKAVIEYVQNRFPAVRIEEARVRDFLASLVAHGLMVTDGAHYLSLALRPPPCGGSPRMQLATTSANPVEARAPDA